MIKFCYCLIRRYLAHIGVKAPTLAFTNGFITFVDLLLHILIEILGQLRLFKLISQLGFYWVLNEPFLAFLAHSVLLNKVLCVPCVLPLGFLTYFGNPFVCMVLHRKAAVIESIFPAELLNLGLLFLLDLVELVTKRA